MMVFDIKQWSILAYVMFILMGKGIFPTGLLLWETLVRKWKLTVWLYNCPKVVFHYGQCWSTYVYKGITSIYITFHKTWSWRDKIGLPLIQSSSCNTSLPNKICLKCNIESIYRWLVVKLQSMIKIWIKIMCIFTYTYHRLSTYIHFKGILLGKGVF